MSNQNQVTKMAGSWCTRLYRKIELKKRDNKRRSRRNSGARQRSTFIWRRACGGRGARGKTPNRASFSVFCFGPEYSTFLMSQFGCRSLLSYWKRLRINILFTKIANDMIELLHLDYLLFQTYLEIKKIQLVFVSSLSCYLLY